YLFQGNEPALNITDTGNLYEYDQEISIVNQEEINLSYYLDDEHDWKCSKIEANIKNIQDTRNWVNNSGFEAPIIYRKYDSYESNHPYQQNKNPGDRFNTIYEPTATYMRAHFKNCSFERYYDFLYVYNNSFTEEYLVLDGNRNNFYSPWIPGNTIEVTYDSDINIQWYGYYIDYYEFVNTSSNYDINSNTWNFNYEEIPNGKNTYGAGEINGSAGMWVGLYSELISGGEYNYSAGAYSELYQDLNISREQVIDGYLSFDYYIQNGLSSNENFIYFEINNKRVYSKGMRDSIDAGLSKWHSTGKIYMDLWINTSNIFESVINNQEINISVGIMSGDDITYSNFQDGFQNIVWFDNVSLVLTTIANSTQSDIDLKINNITLMDNNEWGESSLNLTGSWETNPIKLTVKSLSPKLNFNLDTILYGYHNTTSKIDQLNTEGIIFNILQNGTIYWEFYHNLFMPSQYSDFEFTVTKPNNWKIISVLDPTFIPIPFEGGNLGEDYIKINSTYALFPGWWRFKASSPNYISENNTDMSKDGQWGFNEFYSGDSIRIKTQVNSTNEIPLNLDTTVVNLTIYYPNSSIWYQESKIPLSNGTVIFSDILLTSLNSVGGVYNYTLFWSNGTALGGLK
ncbi:MAG: hypothetical protein KAT66_09940, partial [Candidatus Lokiarchaeota archaeon]|nr:hypothetical protein [Candidatus Lokiarchaeota archaeon]